MAALVFWMERTSKACTQNSDFTSHQKGVRKRTVLKFGLAALAVLLLGQAVCAADTYNMVAVWGSSGTANGQFNIPYWLALDTSGNVYVTDEYNYRVEKFDSGGGYIASWGSSGTGDGQFNFPDGVAVDASGNVYIADVFNNRIEKFDSGGAFLAAWGSQGSGPGQLNRPVGITTDGSGNVYVADSYNNRIEKFDSGGGYITAWGSSGTGNGQFNQPWGVAVDASGNVYVADTWNHRIEKFDPNGNFLTTWGSYGTGNGQFRFVDDLAIDASGNVYATDEQNNRVQKFDPVGNFLTTWGSAGTGDGQFAAPHGIGVDAAGDVYVSDSNNNRVQKFAPSTPPSPAGKAILLHFDEGSGSVAHDSSGSGNDGTINNAIWVDGVSGKALQFNGQNSYVQLNSPVLNTPPYTVEAWVKADFTSGTNAYIIANGGETQYSYGLSLLYETTAQFGPPGWAFFPRSNSGTGGDAMIHGPPSNDWTQLVGTWDGTSNPDSMKLYVDGNLAATGTPSSVITGGANNLRIGSNSASLAAPFLGTIDEVVIYPRVLSDDEVKADYDALKPAPTTPTPTPTPPVELTATDVTVNSGYQGWPTFGREYTVSLKVENPTGTSLTRSISAHETTIPPALKDDTQWILPEMPYQLYFGDQQKEGVANFYYMHTGDPFYYLREEQEQSGSMTIMNEMLDIYGSPQAVFLQYIIDRVTTNLGQFKRVQQLDQVMTMLDPITTYLDLAEMVTEMNSLLVHLQCTPTVTYLYTFTADHVSAELPNGIDPTTETMQIFEGALNDYHGFAVTLQAEAYKYYAYWNAILDETLSLIYDVIGFWLSKTGETGLSFIPSLASMTTSKLADESIQQALDPVSDYTAPIEIKQFHLSEIDSLPDGTDKEYLLQLETTYSDTTGLTDAMIKRNGAIAANDQVWADKLLREQYQYQSMVSNDYHSLKIKAIPFLEEIQQAGFNPTVSDIQSIKTDIAKNGLSKSQVALYKKYGYSDNDLGIVGNLVSKVPDGFYVNYSYVILIGHQLSEDLNAESLKTIAAELGDDAPPYADFTQSTTSGVQPISVKFTDTSLRGPNQWHWAFGDGGVSDQQSPSHTYTTPGDYTVALTVEGSTGSDTRTRYDLIHVIIPGKVFVLPRTLNLASKGAFVVFARLPDGYDVAGIMKDSVTCGGAPTEKILMSKRFPHVFGAVFMKDKLQNVPTGDKVTLTLDGELAQAGKTYEFAGNDTVRVISKKSKIPDIDDDLSRGIDEKGYEDTMFNRYDREKP